jgi:hypothetical protein
MHSVRDANGRTRLHNGESRVSGAEYLPLTAGCCQDEESASDDFMEPNNRTDGSQALEWDIEGMSAETDDFQ